jgi:hypothetical protein
MLEHELEKRYNYKIGEIVVTKVDLWTENNQYLPTGTKLRIVAFAAKVYKTRYPDNITSDSKEYFLNAVLVAQEKDWGNRVRPDFCCIRKIKKGE